MSSLPLAANELGLSAPAADGLAQAVETPNASEPGAWTAAVRKLLDGAQQQIEAGELRGAQRLLEILVARYPDVAAADDARRMLLKLYADPSARLDQTLPIGPSRARAGEREPTTLEPAFANQDQPATDTDRALMARQSLARHMADRFAREVPDRVFFASGSTELGGRGRDVVAAQARWLARYRDVRIVVEGHADDASTGANDQAISEARADAVRRTLIEHGIAVSRIDVTALARTRPIVDCTDHGCAQHNRRAVILVDLPGRRARSTPVAAQPQDQPADLSGIIPAALVPSR